MFIFSSIRSIDNLVSVKFYKLRANMFPSESDTNRGSLSSCGMRNGSSWTLIIKITNQIAFSSKIWIILE